MELQKVDIKAFRWYMESQKLMYNTEKVRADEYTKKLISNKLDKINFCLWELDLFLNQNKDGKTS